jgi:hypothetical protein
MALGSQKDKQIIRNTTIPVAAPLRTALLQKIAIIIGILRLPILPIDPSFVDDQALGNGAMVTIKNLTRPRPSMMID